ncbi:hypothetical protein D9M68_670760 [compost metagenome]
MPCNLVGAAAFLGSILHRRQSLSLLCPKAHLEVPAMGMTPGQASAGAVPASLNTTVRRTPVAAAFARRADKETS